MSKKSLANPYLRARLATAEAALLDRRLKASTQRLISVLALRHTNGDYFRATGDLEAWPSAARLMAELGMAESTLSEAFKQGVEFGYLLRLTPDSQRGAGHTARYRLLPHEPPPSAAFDRKPPEAGGFKSPPSRGFEPEKTPDLQKAKTSDLRGKKPPEIEGEPEDENPEKKNLVPSVVSQGELPLTNAATTPTSAATRGARLSEDWQPSEGDRACAAAQGFTPAEIDRMAKRFRNYYVAKVGKDAARLSWPRTWENWVLTEAERRQKAVKPTDYPPGYAPSPDWCD